MLEKDIIGNLVTDIANDLIGNYLDNDTIAKVQTVSKLWHRIFSNNVLWQRKIIKDFKIDRKLLTLFPIPKDLNTETIYKNLYKKLYTLQYHVADLPSFVKHIFDDKEKLLSFLFAALEVENTLNKTPIEDIYSLVVTNIYAGSIELPLEYVKQKPMDGIDILIHAFAANNHQLADKILEFEKTFNTKRKIQLTGSKKFSFDKSIDSNNYFKLTGNERVLEAAMKSGNLKAVRYLLDLNNDFLLSPTEKDLAFAAGSGNLELLRFLIDPANGFMLVPSYSTLLYGMYSGSMEIMMYLLDPANNFSITPELSILRAAIARKNCEIVKYLTGPKGRLLPQEYHLEEAASYGCIDMVKYFLDQTNNFGLNPSQKTLNCAAFSGNIELVKYFLDEKNNFNLVLNKDVIPSALRSGNSELVLYLLEKDPSLQLTDSDLGSAISSDNSDLLLHLLNPNNKFGLKPDREILRQAASKGSLKVVKFLLDSTNKFNLKLDEKIIQAAIFSEDIGLVAYLLGPEHDFMLSTIKLPYEELNNKSLFDNLLPSWNAMRIGMLALKIGSVKKAEKLLKEAIELCPNYFNRCISAMLADPNKYSLSRATVDYLEQFTHSLKLIKDQVLNFASFSK